MRACVDVDYRDSVAVAGCVVFEAWSDATPLEELTALIPEVEPYRPGEFFRRELPCLLAVLERLEETPEVILVDGHVWLDDGRPGLGAHLHETLARTTHHPPPAGGPHDRPAVVGVAKSPFGGDADRQATDRLDAGTTPGPSTGPRHVARVYRGDSRRPLFVSAVGLELEEAARGVRSMHGDHRVPTLLRRVDRLCRAAPAASG